MIEKPNNVLQLKKVNISRIKYFIQSLTDQEWNMWQHRQNSYSVHSHTQSYPLLWSDNISNNELIIYKKNVNSKIWDLLLPVSL